MLSSLPRKLKKRYPSLRILTYPRGFNPVVFWNNPFVDGITFTPGRLFGDDCCEGRGHNIELKDFYFEVEHDELPRPEIYLTEEEKLWGANQVAKLAESEKDRARLPILIIHPFGSNFPKVLAPEVWGRFTSQWRDHYRIIQVGVEGQHTIPGCDLNFLAPRKRKFGRKLFALISQASRFIGVDSGPMHIARAFKIPSLIVTDGADPQDIFTRRRSFPYYLVKNHSRAFLYEDLPHLYVPSVDEDGLVRKMGDFLLEHRVDSGKS